MVRILDVDVNLAFPLGHHLHCLVAQIPVRLRRGAVGYALADPDAQWRTIASVLDLVGAAEGNLSRLHFLVFPEAATPSARLDAMLAALERRLAPSTVAMFGIEHLRVREYRRLLERFRDENGEALALLRHDVESGDVLDNPVNACCVAVKEAGGRLRVFLEAKTHPFRGEEVLDAAHDLYRGRHLYRFRGHPACFDFMVLVCLDYLWRDLYASNIRTIVDHANRAFFETRRTLDALFVIQCTPKPEHRAYRDVLTGFYGEYLEDTPGVRETATVFANCSGESAIEGHEGAGAFGVSSVAIAARHKLAPVHEPEFSTDDFGGAPVCRLRFGTGTRLWYFNLPLHHELDPRSSRIPVKVHAFFHPEGGGWRKGPRGGDGGGGAPPG
jgi:hypothetical protein